MFIALVVSLLFIAMGLMPITEDYDFYYGAMNEVIITLLVYQCFVFSKGRELRLRSFLFCILLFKISEMTTYCFQPRDSKYLIMTFAIITLISIPIFLNILHRDYGFKSDIYSEKGVYVVFKKPRNFVDFFLSCVYMPVSSVSVIIDGEWYGYTFGKPYKKQKYNTNSDNYLIKIEKCPKTCSIILDNFIDDEWSLKHNCCHIVQNLFSDRKFKFMDGLPSFFIRTLTEEKNK